MLMLMPLQQFCECESRIWVCRGYVSVCELCECELSASESASALVALMFLLVLSIYKMLSACAWKYVIKNILWHVKASIKRFSSIHMPCQAPFPLASAPSHFPHSFVGPASFIANVGTAKLRSRFILCPARYSFRFLGYVSCFFPPFSCSPFVFCYFVGLSVRRFTENYI